jgi:hypothetical protein
MSVVNALFLRFGRVVPASQITPQLADELHSALAKVMMYAKSNNIKLTKQQIDYIMKQTRELDIYEGKGVEQAVKGPKADVIDLSKRLGPDAPYSAQNPEGWMPKEGEYIPRLGEGIKSLKKEVDDLGETASKYKETTVGDFIADYFDMPKKTTPKKTITELNNVKLYGDETFEELDIIKQTGKHPRDKKAKGGRIGYKFGTGKKGIQALKESIQNKFGKKSITTADKVARPESAVTRDMFKDFSERLKQKTTDTEVTLPSGIKGIIDTGYEPKIRKFEGMSKIILSPEEAIKLAKKEKLEGIESLISGESIALSRGQGKGLIVNHNGKIFIREKIKGRPNPIKEDEKAIIDELDEMWNDEGPVQMSMEDLIEFRTQKPAGKGMFTKAEAIRARLENTIKGVSPGDEDYDWVMETFPKWIDEIEKKPSLADNETVWNELAMTGLPENQRFKIYDDGTVDFQTLKPTHQFKLKDDITKHATGGRVGFSAGGIDKVRRALLKMFGGAAATGVAVKTGLGGLLKGGEKAKDVVKTAETVKTAANTPPNYVFDLIKIIKAKGKDITKQAGTIERETVKSYRGVELYETPNGVVIKAEGKTPYEGGKEIQLSLNKTTDVVDEGKKTQKQVSKVEYEEATVRPDPEGKMKDVDFYVDETDHAELKRIVDEEKGFKSGGLAYMLGE